jgi:hypothetical protein
MIINGVLFNADLTDIINELRAQLAINQIPLLGHIQDTPNNLMVSCPYHKGGQERKPSAGIHKKDGTFHCFACGEVHTLQEIISFCLGYTDDMIGAHGWNWLIKNFATVAIEERKDVDMDFSRSNGFRSISAGSTNNNSNGNDFVYVTEQELDSYRYYHPYWKKRKITNEYIIELFDLGYDKDTNCITFPVRDIKGNCLFVARRSVCTKFFSYPSGAEKPLYGLYELSKIWHSEYVIEEHIEDSTIDVNQTVKSCIPGGDVLVCESMLDALTCWEYGKPAVALNGLGTARQFKQLSELPCRKLILATDNDKAGMEARKRIRKNVKNKIITEFLFPEGIKDINDCSKEQFDKLEEVF